MGTQDRLWRLPGFPQALEVLGRGAVSGGHPKALSVRKGWDDGDRNRMQRKRWDFQAPVLLSMATHILFLPDTLSWGREWSPKGDPETGRSFQEPL